MQMAGQ